MSTGVGSLFAVCAGCSVKTCKKEKSTPICSCGRDVTTVAVILPLQGVSSLKCLLRWGGEAHFLSSIQGGRQAGCLKH